MPNTFCTSIALGKPSSHLRTHPFFQHPGLRRSGGSFLSVKFAALDVKSSSQPLSSCNLTLHSHQKAHYNEILSYILHLKKHRQEVVDLLRGVALPRQQPFDQPSQTLRKRACFRVDLNLWLPGLCRNSPPILHVGTFKNGS